MRLLIGEVEELADALEKTQGMTRAVPDEDPELELADVALYLVHLSNTLGVDLGAAISAKERINAQRFRVTPQLAA
jgi:dCTP diphosphatase